MEKSNIRWIELISASLIVVCSVGLVISLWNTLSATSRYFPSLVFLVATVAVHAAGQYTLRQWKLRSTSRGILQIGLMLIPLAVLVGILLSDREGQPPQLDGMTILVIAVGTVIYGGAAVTACRALFASRYLPVSAAVIIGALTLVPIHFMGAAGRLEQPWISTLLIPLVVAGLWNAWLLSQSAHRRLVPSSGRSRRTATQVVQVIFAATVPAYFWLTKAGGFSGLSDSAIFAVGLLLAGWASWGWVTSLLGASFTQLASSRESEGPSTTPQPSPNQAAVVPIRQRGAWLSVVAWGLAFVCSIALAAILWQMADHRFFLTGFLVALSAWWISHGLHCRLWLSQMAGAVSGILAVALVLEGVATETSEHLHSTDWLSLSRIASLNVSSIGWGLMASVLLFLQQRASAVASLSSCSDTKLDSTNRNGSQLVGDLAFSILLATGCVWMGTTLLTTLASFVAWSTPAYGGNWAPILLVLNGAILLAAGFAWELVRSSGRISFGDPRLGSIVGKIIFPVGQAILLLGAIRLCQSATIVPEWIAKLRPQRAWSVGGGMVALTWAGLAASLRCWILPSRSGQIGDSSSFPIQSLTLGTVALSLASGVFYWRLSDQFAVASMLGWILPVTFLLLFLANRQSGYRELSIVFSSGWLVSLLISIGWSRQWWERLGGSATVSILVLSVLAVLGISRIVFKEQEDDQRWLYRGFRWSTASLLAGSWVVWLASLLVPLIVHYWISLSPQMLETATPHFIWMPLDWARSALALLTAAALSGFTFWTKSILSSSLRMWLATIPVVVASVIGCCVPAPYSAPTFLWLLASMMIAMEILSLTRTPWGRRLSGVNEALLNGRMPERSDHWLALTLTAGLGVLVTATSGVGLSHVVGRIPEPLSALVANMENWSGWLTNCVRLSPWMAPVVLLLAVKWLVGLWMSAPAPAVSRRGFAVGIAISLGCSVAGAVEPVPFVLLGLQSYTLAMVIVSWKTLSFAAAWNYLGLRQLDKNSPPLQLLSKARGGSRWRQAEQAAWKLWTSGMVAAALLSLTAAALVVCYPLVQRPELQQLGGVWTLLSVALAIALWWILGIARGMSKFGLLALALGLIGPMLAAAYASWLMMNPTGKFASAADFEPYRLLVGFWLAALTTGLIIRIHSRLRGWQMSRWGEWIWVALAVVVGLLAINGLPTDSHWASAQLAVLALIIALSAEASGMVWRGWLAALAATLAWLPWLSGGGAGDWIFYPWQALWGITGVGLVCVASRIAFQHWSMTDGAGRTLERPSRWTVDRASCILVSILSMLLSGLWILMQGSTVLAPNAATWMVSGLLVANLVLAIGRLWDKGPSQRGLSVYLATLSLTVVVVNLASSWREITRIHAELTWLCGFLGAMTLMAVLLREMSLQRMPIHKYFHWRNLATEEKLRSARNWMAGWHTIAALICLLPGVWLVLTMPHVGSRLAAIALPMLGAAAILPVSFETRRGFQRGSVLLLISATLILAWWADLPAAWSVRQENQSWQFVHRTFMACVVLGMVYPMVAWRRYRVRAARQEQPGSVPFRSLGFADTGLETGQSSDPWTSTLMVGGWICMVLAGVVGLGMILGTWIGHWSEFPSTVGIGVKCFTLIGWGCLFARLLQAAARPLNMDLLISLHSRRIMVYLAEIVLVLGSLSAYQHFPNLFSGVFLQWWPLVVFGIAFVSAGIGQLLKRAQPVLADPILQSSLLLPLIPLAGVWWAKQNSPAAHWGEWGSYWMLLAAASSLYGLYGWVRGSVGLRVVSAAAALLSFWALLLSRPDLQFFDRPQVWLLPPAVGCLIFVEWNKRKLDAKTVTLTRYVGILIAYLSSSAEVFLKAIEGNLWQPLALLFLALCGAVAGMLMRIRAFLYCGVTFIMVALFGMVWHAAQAIDQVWPWWVFGIATGVGLIVLLGYFEKNRSKVLKYLEELKTWQK